jgi:hypothetical protein
MTLSSSDPDAAERFQWKYELACSQFKTGLISEAVFGGCLYCLGYRGARLKDEVRYQGGLVGVREKVSGLPARS